MIKQAIEKVVNHKDLTFDESQTVLDEIMNGETSEIETASLLTALTAKIQQLTKLPAPLLR